MEETVHMLMAAGAIAIIAGGLLIVGYRLLHPLDLPSSVSGLRDNRASRLRAVSIIKSESLDDPDVADTKLFAQQIVTAAPWNQSSFFLWILGSTLLVFSADQASTGVLWLIVAIAAAIGLCRDVFFARKAQLYLKKAASAGVR